MDQIPHCYSLDEATAEVWGPRAAPIHVVALWNRRRGHPRKAAYIRRAGELSEVPNRGEGLIALGPCESARKTAAAPLEIDKDAVPSLGVKRVEALSEERLVIHAGPPLVAVTLADRS